MLAQAERVEGSVRGIELVEPQTAVLLEIRTSGDKGQGVFAAEPLRRGDVAIVGKPVRRSAERTWQTVQVDVDQHIKIDLPLELVNHSCAPTCGPRANSFGGYDLVALRDIAAGEEITFGYCMTEWLLVGFDECRCASDQCRGSIRGANHI